MDCMRPGRFTPIPSSSTTPERPPAITNCRPSPRLAERESRLPVSPPTSVERRGRRREQRTSVRICMEDKYNAGANKYRRCCWCQRPCDTKLFHNHIKVLRPPRLWKRCGGGIRNTCHLGVQRVSFQSDLLVACHL